MRPLILFFVKTKKELASPGTSEYNARGIWRVSLNSAAISCDADIAASQLNG